MSEFTKRLNKMTSVWYMKPGYCSVWLDDIDPPGLDI